MGHLECQRVLIFWIYLTTMHLSHTLAKVDQVITKLCVCCVWMFCNITTQLTHNVFKTLLESCGELVWDKCCINLVWPNIFRVAMKMSNIKRCYNVAATLFGNISHSPHRVCFLACACSIIMICYHDLYKHQNMIYLWNSSCTLLNCTKTYCLRRVWFCMDSLWRLTFWNESRTVILTPYK